MRIVHISDTAFIGVPDGACLHVAHCYDYNLAITIAGVATQTVLFSSVNEPGPCAPEMKAHVLAEAERFKDWLMNASQGCEFTFERVLDFGALVQDTPCRIREDKGGPA